MTCTKDKLEGFKIPYVLMKTSITARLGSFEFRVQGCEFLVPGFWFQVSGSEFPGFELFRVEHVIRDGKPETRNQKLETRNFESVRCRADTALPPS